MNNPERLNKDSRKESDRTTCQNKRKTEKIFDKSGAEGLKKYAEKKNLADKYGLEVGDNTDSVYKKYGRVCNC